MIHHAILGSLGSAKPLSSFPKSAIVRKLPPERSRLLKICTWQYEQIELVQNFAAKAVIAIENTHHNPMWRR